MLVGGPDWEVEIALCWSLEAGDSFTEMLGGVVSVRRGTISLRGSGERGVVGGVEGELRERSCSV